MAERAERTSKRLGGTPSFLYATVATFAAWRNVPFSVQVDDEPPLELVANNVICANGREFGGGIKVCPQAEPDDGLLDVLVWGDVGKLDLALNLPRLYRGTHLGHKKVTVLRARRVRVEPSRPLPLELDGELPGTTPATFEVVPARAAPARPGLGGSGDDLDRRARRHDAQQLLHLLVAHAHAAVRDGARRRVRASSVPWIATGPPRVQPVSTGEKLERPSAPGPYGPARIAQVERARTRRTSPSASACPRCRSPTVSRSRSRPPS